MAVLLKGKGIDLVHNRFLILQGEVEQISQMKPKAENPNEEGMLEYLEDIIGSSRLKVTLIIPKNIYRGVVITKKLWENDFFKTKDSKIFWILQKVIFAELTL